MTATTVLGTFRPTVLGTFGKGLDGAVALNFSPSAGSDCSDSCSHKVNGTCYAAKLESFRPALVRNLRWKRSNLTTYLRRILVSLPVLRSSPWVRFSAFGTLPAPSSLTATQRALFGVLAGLLDTSRTHVPVETLEKYRGYKELGFVPRLSLGSVPVEELEVPSSMTVDAPHGREVPGWTKQAKEAARRARGRLALRFPTKKIRVCPAVLGTAKCGACRLCADPKHGGADLVIYPEHP